jgi:NifU-like protein
MDLNQEVCACASKSVGDVVDAVKEFNLSTVEEVASKIEAGKFCKTCTTKHKGPYKSLHIDEVIKKVQKGKL